MDKTSERIKLPNNEIMNQVMKILIFFIRYIFCHGFSTSRILVVRIKNLCKNEKQQIYDFKQVYMVLIITSINSILICTNMEHKWMDQQTCKNNTKISSIPLKKISTMFIMNVSPPKKTCTTVNIVHKLNYDDKDQ